MISWNVWFLFCLYHLYTLIIYILICIWLSAVSDFLTDLATQSIVLWSNDAWFINFFCLLFNLPPKIMNLCWKKLLENTKHPKKLGSWLVGRWCNGQWYGMSDTYGMQSRRPGSISSINQICLRLTLQLTVRDDSLFNLYNLINAW